MKDTRLPVIIIGGGGHAKVVADALQLCGYDILGFTDVKLTRNILIEGVSFLGSDDFIGTYGPDEILLANGIGSIRDMTARRNIYESFSLRNYRFATIIHPTAIIARDVILKEGAQIMAGAVIQTGCRIGCNAIVNTRASIDHDCEIGDNVHIAPGCVLSGNVIIGSASHVGTGAVMTQGISVGVNCIVGAGAVVISDVRAGANVVGIPAREVIL